jgi:glycerol-3-phosphate acyltransferase PlsY
VGELFALAPVLLTSMVVAYVLGALPLADQLSRRHGIDIFSTGSGLAGASNVLKSVGKLPALVVILGDMGKGALALIVAGLLGVDGGLIMLPFAAAVLGHWRSIFSGFRGGDGLAVLGGAAIPLFGAVGVLSVVVTMVVALGAQRLPYSSLLGVVFGYATIVAFKGNIDGATVLTLGYGGISGLVLAYALVGHRQRRQVVQWDKSSDEPLDDDWDDLEDADGAAEQSGFR